MVYLVRLSVLFIAFFFSQACFTTLPMSDGHELRGQQSVLKWLSVEPLWEVFPVDYNRTVKPARLSLQLNANSTQASYALKMLRNVGNINDALGTPLREKHRTTKQITLHSATYQETGKGGVIVDAADMQSETDYSGTVRLTQQNGMFSGALEEKSRLKATVAFMNMKGHITGKTQGDFLAIRNIDTDAVIGVNIPALPIFPNRTLHTGDQWEISGYTEQKTVYTYTSGTPPASLSSATLLLLTYQFHGETEWQGRQCAYIEFYGESYEMKDLGGKSSLAALKGVAKTLSKSSMSEIKSYLTRREYNTPSVLQGSFQASAKMAGYSLIDLKTKKVVLSKMGKEGLTGGGSSTGLTGGTGKGIFREQWILQEQQ